MSTQTCLLCEQLPYRVMTDPKRFSATVIQCKSCYLIYSIPNDELLALPEQLHLKAKLRRFLFERHKNADFNNPNPELIRFCSGKLSENDTFLPYDSKGERPQWSEIFLGSLPELPDFVEQSDILMEFVGDKAKSELECDIDLDWLSIIPMLGVRSKHEAQYISYELQKCGYFDLLGQQKPQFSLPTARLTFDGWQRYHEIKRKPSKSNLAFMAMPFGRNLNNFTSNKPEPEWKDRLLSETDFALDSVFEDWFKPAVAQTGFKLQTVADPDVRRAGLIDDHIRVEIRKSHFVVAELTGDNAGAYFEAGFAEGLDRKVVYTCHEGWQTHFDTRHHQTIFWHQDNLQAASQALKDVIRNSLPDKARMEDTPPEHHL